MILAAIVTAAALTAVTLGCYGLYRLECKVSGETPVKWFGW
jgi:hypothetical protein